MKILSPSEWRSRRDAHEARVQPWIEPRLARRSRGESHPVEDFLFEYYTYRPAQLHRWHPGLGIALQDGEEFLTHKNYRASPQGVTADPTTLPPRRRVGIHWLRKMLAATADRPPALGCFGLHEWAMVYRAETIRHESWPLRLSSSEIVAVVESLGPRCTHFDALRFFTPVARPLNKHQPTRATSADFEQPGCLHTNMDLYKWAMKSLPFASSELVADCFGLARKIRTLDMRASPYDFSAMSLDPVRIETPAGRAEYEDSQRDFARKAAPLRQRLIALCDGILATEPDAARRLACANAIL